MGSLGQWERWHRRLGASAGAWPATARDVSHGPTAPSFDHRAAAGGAPLRSSGSRPPASAVDAVDAGGGALCPGVGVRRRPSHAGHVSSAPVDRAVSGLQTAGFTAGSAL